MEKIEKKVKINASAEKVWAALTEQDKLGEWMLMPTTFEPVVGKEFTFKAESSEKWDGLIHCAVKEVEVNRKLVYTWNPGIDADTLVSISISETEGQTELTLVHTGWEELPAEMRPKLLKDHSKGWDERIHGTLLELFS
jgi:uncharacterized protein YndB with AHSA1/START domain